MGSKDSMCARGIPALSWLHNDCVLILHGTVTSQLVVPQTSESPLSIEAWAVVTNHAYLKTINCPQQDGRGECSIYNTVEFPNSKA